MELLISITDMAFPEFVHKSSLRHTVLRGKHLLAFQLQLKGRTMLIPAPTAEHQFLLQFVGEWSFESECIMGPDQPPMITKGTQSIKPLGSFWTLGAMESLGPDGDPMHSMMTLGFDPVRGKFVGSFVASCMTHHWLYEGSLDVTGRILTLDAEGPSFTGDGSMARYQDIIEAVDHETYLFSSQIQDASGNWVKFMHGKHIRVA